MKETLGKNKQTNKTKQNTWQVKGVEQIEQYQFVEKSHYFRRRGPETLVESLFLPSWFASQSLFLCTLSPISVFYPPDIFFICYFRLRRIICILLLCNKRYRLLCPFKRKRAFISLSSLAWGKFLSLCTCTRSFARVNDAKIVRSRDAECNTEESSP